MSRLRAPGEASCSGRRDVPETVTVTVEEVLRQARGSRWLGVDRGIWVWVVPHALGAAALMSWDTDVTLRLRGASKLAGFPNGDHVYAAILAASLVAHIALYASLYRSDPGWVREGAPPPRACCGPCRWCSLLHPLRSRHDHNTGQCVVCFDHFCPLLATAIGDCNRARFLYLLLSQTYLIVWATLVAWDALRPCLPPGAQPALCWAGGRWRPAAMAFALVGLLAALSGFAGLAAFHAWLAATNQTTYEVGRGAQVPYLAPHYAGYAGPHGVNLVRGRDIRRFLGRALRGELPPRPFDCGMLENLNVFFFARKPYDHVPRVPLAASM